MPFQGHIENGLVVLDEPVALPDGTVVRIEPVASSAEEPPFHEHVAADTDRSYTVQQMAHAWKAISKPIPDDVSISVDPDEYPLF